jgi:hypothetical protein
MNQHLLVKIPEHRTVQLGTPHRCLAKIGALIWTVRRSGIFPAQLNDSELIRGSLINPDSELSFSSATAGATPSFAV